MLLLRGARFSARFCSSWRANRVAGNMRRFSVKGGGRDNRWTIRKRAGGEIWRGGWGTGGRRDKGSIPRAPLSAWTNLSREAARPRIYSRRGSLAGGFHGFEGRRGRRPGNQRSTSSGNGLPERPPSSFFLSRARPRPSQGGRVAEGRRGGGRFAVFLLEFGIGQGNPPPIPASIR